MASTIHIGKVRHPEMDATQRFVAAMLVVAAVLAVVAFLLVNVVFR